MTRDFQYLDIVHPTSIEKWNELDMSRKVKVIPFLLLIDEFHNKINTPTNIVTRMGYCFESNDESLPISRYCSPHVHRKMGRIGHVEKGKSYPLPIAHRRISQ